jgi:hypothetical protein
VSESTVWAGPSLFVQQTVVPGATVTDGGTYAKPLMSINLSPDTHGPGCALACDPTTTAAAHIAQAADRAPSAFIGP